MGFNDSDAVPTVRRLIEGYQISQAIHASVMLGIADLLAAGSRTNDELAAATGTHAPTLYRLLRALASVEVLRELDDRRFELTTLGECLRTDVPHSLASWAAFVGRPYYWQAWTGLLHSVHTGENAFRHINGMDVWTYRSNYPEENAIFNRAMIALSRRSFADLLATYDFGRFHTLVDVGGGNGALLAAILGAHPMLQAILFDQPHVVAAAPALLAEAGVAERCQVVAGDFFVAVPRGADAYVLRVIIHDWEDEEAIRILRTVRAAIRTDGLLLLIEHVIGPPNEGREAKFSDLNMLVSPGGRERTQEEFATLLAAADFNLVRVVDAGAYAVIEATPV